MAGPNQGEVYDGYRFLGGDPKSEASWERASPASGPEAAGFQSLGGGWYKGPDGGSYQVGRGGAMVQRSEGTGSSSAGEGGVGKLTEDQGKAGGYARLMADAERSYQQALNEGFNPTGIAAGIANFTDNIPGLGGLGNFIRDDAGDRARQAELQWTDAQLKAMSGAASPEQEVVRNQITNFARPGQNYEYLGDRLRQARTTAFQASKIRAGKAAADVSYPEETFNSKINPETGLPSYPEIAQLTAGITETPLPEGGYGGSGPDAPTGPGSSQAEAIDFRDPNNRGALADLIATGGWLRDGDGQPYYVEPGAIAQAREEGDEAVGNGVYVRPDRADWTPEGAVRQRREMWQPARQVDAFVRGAADAGSLEFADEIAAGADAAIGRGNGQTVGDRYRSNVRVQRAIDEADGQDAGFARGAGQVAGYGVAALTQGPRLLARGSQFASPLLNRAVTGVRNALTGGAIAGTAAAGQAEGNALQRAQEFLKAAPVGAAVGVAAPVAVNAVAGRVAAPLAAGRDFVGRQVGRAGQALKVPGATRLTERSTPNALNAAVEQFGRRMGPRRVGALSDTARSQRDLGFDPTLADLVDDAGQGQLRALGSLDTPARPNAVAFGRSRRAAAQDDVSNIARRFVSDDPRTAARVAADLEDAQRLASGPAYEAARASPPITVSADVGEALFSGEGPSTIRAASRAYKSSVQPEERALALELERMAQAADDGVPAGAIEMSVGAADLLSRYLGKAGGSDANLSRIYQGLGRAVRNQAREQSPAYEAALSGYAERAQLDDAADFGRRFLNRRGAQDFANEARAMLPAQRDVARVAARDAIEDAGSTTGGAATLLDDLSIGRGTGQRSDALIADPEAMRATADAARMRLQAGRNVDPRAGSNTNLNRQDTENVDNAVEFLSDGAQMVARPISGTISVVARRFQNRGFNRQEAEELVNAAIDPSRTDELIALLQTKMSRKEARTLARAVQRQVSSGSGSSGVEQ